MQELSIENVLSKIEDGFVEKNLIKVEQLLWPALDQFPLMAQLWFYAGNLFFQREINSLAVRAYERAYELEPAAIVLGNMGAALRRLNMHETAIKCLERGLEFDPESASILTNLAAAYVNEGTPDRGIELCRRALKVKPDFDRARWNMGLCLLEKGNYDEGFYHYRAGLGNERLIRTYGDPEPEWFTRENFEQSRGKTLVTWGEQGIGDELMFSTVLREACAHFSRVIFEAHPRLINIYARSFADVDNLILMPTRKVDNVDAPNELRPIEYRSPIGDLAAIWRRSKDDYDRCWQAHGPYWKPREDRRQLWRSNLEALAEGKKIIGLALRGGVIKTMRGYRSASPKDLAPILSRPDCIFVSFDYEDMTGPLEYINQTYGEGKLLWFPAITQHFDYDNTLALVSACDHLVTVCQSVAHLAAGAGVPTSVMVPSKPAWRYGLTDERWFLYPGEHCHLFRQDSHGSWKQVVENVNNRIGPLEPACQLPTALTA